MGNKAAWLVAAKERPLKVDDAPMPEPGPDDIIIRNHAVAINPVDWAVQNIGILAEDFPFIGGEDVAGEICAVGSNVKDFKKGDRVITMAGDTEVHEGKPRYNNACGAFQLYVVSREPLIAKIPDKVSYAEACVLPLCLSTAAVSIFQKDTLALPHPQIHPKPTGKVIAVWGAGSSCGSCGVQLVKAAGYEVAATASEHNLEYLRSLGADYVFDYKSETVVDDIVSALKAKEFGGAFDAVVDPESLRKCGQIASRLGGNKFVATVIPPNHPMLRIPNDVPEDVKFGFNWGSSLKDNEVGPAVWKDWLSPALENGSMKCKPDPLVVGQGLEKIQEAMDKWRKGVSAQKIVVGLP